MMGVNYMKSLYIYLLGLVLVLGLIFFPRVNNQDSKINFLISDSVSSLINLESPKENICSEEDEAKLMEFGEILKEKGYIDISISEYMPEGEDRVYLLAEAKNSNNEEIEKGIAYITVKLTENERVEELIVSSIVTIRENKDNF